MQNTGQCVLVYSLSSYLHLLDSFSIIYEYYLRGEGMSVARQKGVGGVHGSKALQGLVLVVGGH